MSYEFRSLNLQGLDYNASTNTPPLAALANGGQYIVGTQGRLTGATVAGAQTGADVVLLQGDTVQCLDGAYSLASAAVTASQIIGIGTGELFESLQEAMDYLRQREIDAGVTLSVSLLPSYTGIELDTVEFAHPQASQIQVLGIASSETISACTGVTGSIGNLAVSYTLANPISGLAVGDIVIIDQETTDDAQATAFFGSHCGTWEVSAVSGTAVTVQNTQVMRVALTPANFDSARMTKVTKVEEQGDFSNAENIVVGNIAFFHDLNKYVLYGKNGSLLISGFLGAGSTAASANTTQVVLTENFDILSLNYQAINSGGATYTIGLNSVFAPNGGKSSIQVASGQGAIVIGDNVNVQTLICGTAILDADLRSQITCQYKYGGYYSEGGSLFAYNDVTCNVNSFAANYTIDGSIFFISQICNSNQNGNFTTAGNVVIVSQIANNNTNTANANNVEGKFYVGTQTSCDNNLIGNSCGSGSIIINSQVSCDNNTQFGNVVVSNGNIQINSQTSCTGNGAFNNQVVTGKIIISGGASTTTGSVTVPFGGGSVCKTGGTSPFTVTDAPTPTGYAVDTTLTPFDYFSIATANNVDFTLPLASTVQPGVQYIIENGGAFTGVTVAPNAADTIDGSASAITLLSRENLVLVVTAANSWSVIGNESSVVPPAVPVTLSGTQTIGVDQTNVGVGANGTALTLPILSSTVLGTVYTIKNFNFISVTYQCNAADEIDGNAPAPIILAPQESVQLQAYSASTWATL